VGSITDSDNFLLPPYSGWFPVRKWTKSL